MRPRYDFYTFCPKCEIQVRLTLAAKLQASRGGRSGCSCSCKGCQHEWVSIQEWIFRDLPRSEINVMARPTPVFVPSGHAQSGAGISRSHLPATQSVPSPHAWSWESQMAASHSLAATQ